MTPEDKGRHCQVCEKTVYDFTNKTDEQIVKTFDKTKNLCGRFKSQQLDREIVLRRKERNNLASIAASGLLAFLALGTQDANAQGEPQIVQTEIIDHDTVKGKVAQSVLNERTISGTVTNQTGLPLAGINVIIKGTTIGVITDSKGKFVIKVKTGQSLILNRLGLTTLEIRIKKQSSYNLVMVPELIQVLGEVDIVAGYPEYHIKNKQEAIQKKVNTKSTNKQ